MEEINYKHPKFLELNYDFPNEKWKKIDGYDGRYMVSSIGRVKFMGCSWNTGNNVITKGCKIKKPIVDRDGYLKVSLFYNQKVKTIMIHRLVCKYFVNYNEKETVNHKDAIKYNNNWYNLEWNTVQENINHSVKNKLWDCRGSNQVNSILKEDDIPVIRLRLKLGESQRIIGEYYGVSRETIKSIKSGQTWSHIK